MAETQDTTTDVKEDEAGSGAIQAHNCWMGFINFSGQWLNSITLTHSRSDNSPAETQTWAPIPNNAYGWPILAVSYQTGSGAPTDYWQISGTYSGGATFTSDKIKCNLTANDDKKQGIVTLNGNSFTVECPVSGSCSGSL